MGDMDPPPAYPWGDGGGWWVVGVWMDVPGSSRPIRDGGGNDQSSKMLENARRRPSAPAERLIFFSTVIFFIFLYPPLGTPRWGPLLPPFLQFRGIRALTGRRAISTVSLFYYSHFSTDPPPADPPIPAHPKKISRLAAGDI